MIMLFSCNNKRQEALIRNAIETESTLARLNIAELENGNGIYSDVRTEWMITPNNNPENQEKLNRLNSMLGRMSQVNVETGQMIRMIDMIKINLLTGYGEKLNLNPHDPNRILQAINDPKYPEVPARFNLSEIQSAGKTVSSDPAHILNELNKYRLKITEIMGTYSEGNKTWSIKPFVINGFESQKDLRSAVGKMIRSSQANPLDERVLTEVYCILTETGKEEKYENLPLITVMSNLSLLQNKILTARRMAIRHIRNDFNRFVGGLMFNEARAIAYGPDVVKRGEEIKLQGRRPPGKS